MLFKCSSYSCYPYSYFVPIFWNWNIIYSVSTYINIKHHFLFYFFLFLVFCSNTFLKWFQFQREEKRAKKKNPNIFMIDPIKYLFEIYYTTSRFRCMHKYLNWSNKTFFKPKSTHIKIMAYSILVVICSEVFFFFIWNPSYNLHSINKL